MRSGGEGGSRTHEELPLTAFRVRRTRPLCDLSERRLWQERSERVAGNGCGMTGHGTVWAWELAIAVDNGLSPAASHP